MDGPIHSSKFILRNIGHEMRAHIPFTMAGTLTGILLMVLMVWAEVSHHHAEQLFWIAHPAHVFLSAVATTGLYRAHGRGGILATIVIGYVGCIGITTLSDSLIPYACENFLGLHSHVHAGFIEMRWLVNPLAFAGIAVGCWWPRSHYPHAGHVLLSTWASLFHTMMALGDTLNAVTLITVFAFLFLAVWIPCCTSDIVFPLLFARKPVSSENGDCSA